MPTGISLPVAVKILSKEVAHNSDRAAVGGTVTEIYSDRSVRLAPIDRETAEVMIAEVKGVALLRGFRARPRGDLDALVALSRTLSAATCASPSRAGRTASTSRKPAPTSR